MTSNKIEGLTALHIFRSCIRHLVLIVFQHRYRYCKDSPDKAI